MDINIDELGNVVWRESKGHRANNHKYTKEWDKYFEEHPNPTREQVLEQRERSEINIHGSKDSDIPAE